MYKKVADYPRRGELIAEIRSIFGEVIEQVYSPIDLDTVVVGIEANPVAKTGNRIVSILEPLHNYLERTNMKSKRFI